MRKKTILYGLLAVVVVAVLIAVVALNPFGPKATKPDVSYEDALAAVQEKMPARKYMTNAYLPKEPVDGPTPGGPKKTYKITVGGPWILNDEETPWYAAEELGYYKEEGLEVKLVAGGMGADGTSINHLQLLGSGINDIAIIAGAQGVPAAVASPTWMDIVAVGTFLKGMPYCFITTNKDLIGKEITPKDLVGRTVGYQGSTIYTDMLLDKYGIPREKVKTQVVGYDLASLLTGQVDFYPGWIMNQPRFLPAGTPWNKLMYRDYVYNEYSDVVAVRAETLKTADGQDMVRRFLRATYRGIDFMLKNPQEAAQIAAKYASEAKITPEQALQRFELQKDLVVGRDGHGLMWMSADEWDKVVATNYQYHQIQLPTRSIPDQPQ